MKTLVILAGSLLLAAGLVSGQTLATPPPTTVNSAALPSLTIGVGPSWTRGSAYAANADVDIAIRVGTSNWYSWSTVSTPITAAPAGGILPGTPLVSTITTGGAWVAAQSASGAVSLITIVQAGLSASATASVAFTGSVGVAFRVGKKPIYVMPYAKASNASAGTNGAFASAVLQPGVMILYGFGGK